MSKRLPLVIVLLVGVSLVFAALIVKELTSVPRVARPRPQPAASVSTSPPAAAPAAPAAVTAGSYAVVASRNLFSPTRTEAPVAPVAAAPPPPAPILPKPNLFGVVLQDSTPIAYLEDPVSKRVARYRVGDSVAGGTVQAIGSDTVTLARPEGQVVVRLHDPTRPKPATPTAPIPAPTPTPGMPTVNPPQPGAPGAVTPQFRRPLPPGVLGRVPPQPTNAPTPQ